MEHPRAWNQAPGDDVVIELEGNIGWVRLNRPSRANSCTPTTYRDVRDAFRWLDVNDDVSAAIITGNGKAFSTGGDLDWLVAVLEDKLSPTATDFRASSPQLAHMYGLEDNFPVAAMLSCSKPIVAAVNGLAIGGGFTMALASDFIVASEEASFILPEVDIGVIEVWLPRLLASRVGSSTAKQLLLDGGRLSASEALEASLVDKVVAPAILDKEASDLASRLAKKSQVALRHYRQMFYDMMPPFRGYDRMYDTMVSTAALDRLRSFQEKRATDNLVSNETRESVSLGLGHKGGHPSHILSSDTVHYGAMDR